MNPANERSAKARVTLVALSFAVGTACGGGSSPSAPTPTPAATPSPAPAPRPSGIPFTLNVEWIDANWTVSFQGQTFTGGGNSGERPITLSAPAGSTQTLTGTFSKVNRAGAFGAFGLGFGYLGSYLNLEGVLFGSTRLISGPPRSFVNFCSVAWTSDFPTTPNSFVVQFAMTSTNSTSGCP